VKKIKKTPHCSFFTQLGFRFVSNGSWELLLTTAYVTKLMLLGSEKALVGALVATYFLI